MQRSQCIGHIGASFFCSFTRSAYCLYNMAASLSISPDVPNGTAEDEARPASDVEDMRTSESSETRRITVGDLPSGSKLLTQIRQLQADQQALKDQKKQLAKAMRNAQRKKRRIVVKAAVLTNEDLLEVLSMRGERQKEAAAAAPPPASGAA